MSSSTSVPTPGGLWRLLLFDSSDPADPRWIITSVTLASDVRPATTADNGRRFTDWADVTEWVRLQTGEAKVSLVPVAVACWRIDPGDPR